VENPVPVQKGKVLCGLFTIYNLRWRASENSLQAVFFRLEKQGFIGFI
tara:strand:+ start:25 stop:168 length:144 start_codon:yes stop_codon:yes gene_type:complete